MILYPFMSFYGGKWKPYKHYPAPTYDCIIEPFAGSAGYSVRNYNHKVKLYDIDPSIVAVWDYLIHTSSQEILNLPLEFDNVDDLTIPEEAKLLIGFWLNRGSAVACKQPSSWMRSGKYPGSFWGQKIRERIATQVECIRHWTIEQKSFEEVPTHEGTWFVDPPYSTAAGRHYRYSEIDYVKLGEWCQTLPGQVIVCEQSPADWLPFEPLADFPVNSGGRGERKTTRSVELMWKTAG